MSNLVIGNIVALMAAIIMVYLGTLNDKKRILYFQTIQIALSIASNAILGGIPGVIINAVSLYRNILCYKEKLGLKEKIIITILATVLILVFNNLGVWGLLPLVATITYVWLMNTKDVKKFKLLIAFSAILWFLYDLNIKSYTYATFDMLCAIVSVITALQIKKQ